MARYIKIYLYIMMYRSYDGNWLRATTTLVQTLATYVDALRHRASALYLSASTKKVP